MKREVEVGESKTTEEEERKDAKTAKQMEKIDKRSHRGNFKRTTFARQSKGETATKKTSLIY